MNNYSSYKDTNIPWIGDIPIGWSLKSLKHIFIEKKSTKNSDLGCGSISFGRVIYKDDEKILESTKESYQEVLNGEFLINPLNLNYDLKSLRIGLSRINVVVSQGYIVLNIKDGFVSEYYEYLLRKFDVEHMKSLGQGVRQTISYTHIKEEKLVVPPIDEQNRISNYLDNKTNQIDSLISKIEKKVDLLKEQRTSLINLYVTKGLDPNVEMKDSGIDWIGQIPKHWTLSKVKWATTKIGSGITPKGGADVYSDDGIPFLRSQNIHFDGLRLDEVVFISEEIDNAMLNSRVQRNDILYNITGGSIGRCCLVETDERMNVNQHVCIMRPSSKTIPSYLLSVLCSEIGQSQLKMNLTGSGREGLNFENLGKFYIPLTDKDEQNKIGSKIRNLNEVFFNLESKLKTRVERLNEYRQSLISSVVTGKVRVTEEIV